MNQTSKNASLSQLWRFIISRRVRVGDTFTFIVLPTK
jgi:hypothetical protein